MCPEMFLPLKGASGEGDLLQEVPFPSLPRELGDHGGVLRGPVDLHPRGGPQLPHAAAPFAANL